MRDLTEDLNLVTKRSFVTELSPKFSDSSQNGDRPKPLPPKFGDCSVANYTITEIFDGCSVANLKKKIKSDF